MSIYPFVTAICVPGSSIGTVTYGQLKEFIINCAQAARKAESPPGAVAAISEQYTDSTPITMLGLSLLGAATISLQVSQVPKGVVVDAILTDVVGRFSLKQGRRSERG